MLAFAMTTSRSLDNKMTEPGNYHNGEASHNIKQDGTKSLCTEPTFYKIRSVPGRGKGAIATRNIVRGTRLIAEAPMFQVHMKSPESVVEQILANLDRLPADQKALYEDLHAVNCKSILPSDITVALETRDFETQKDKVTVERLISIFYTNFFAFASNRLNIGGLFMTISRINHSCVPNAHWAYNERLNQMTIHAAKDIVEGTEITISYVPTATRTREQRYHDLQAYQFACRCEACENPEESDDHRARMKQLNDSIGKYTDGSPTRDEYQIALDMIEEYIDLFHKEKLVGRELEDRFNEAADINSEIGDLPKAKEYAERTRQYMLVLLGEDHDDYMTVLSLLSELRAKGEPREPS